MKPSRTQPPRRPTMSHFSTALTISRARGSLLRRPRRDHRRGPHLGRRLPQPLGARQVVRSTHGVNCTGSCSWKIYVKGGIVTWETQQTDYPRTRWDMPNHEPRGCARGASYSWYLYSANRVKYPMVRGRLLKTGARRDSRTIRWKPGRRSSRTTRSAAITRGARAGRLRAVELGRGQRDRRRRQRLHDQEARPRPHHRLLADLTSDILI